MREEQFRTQLLGATYSAIRFGQDYVWNRLSLRSRYVVVLNQSCDGHRTPEEVVYPEEDGCVREDLDDAAVVDLLYRDGRCPAWIDISVLARPCGHTLLELACCGRFQANDERMYYFDRGTQPFGIKSPNLPARWKHGRRFWLPRPSRALQVIRARAAWRRSQIETD